MQITKAITEHECCYVHIQNVFTLFEHRYASLVCCILKDIFTCRPTCVTFRIRKLSIVSLACIAVL